jgi:hypothetical protein
MISIRNQLPSFHGLLLAAASSLRRMAMPAWDIIDTPAAVDAVVWALLILLTALI